MSGRCGTAAMGKLYGNRVSRVRAVDGIGVRPGDSVVVGLGEGALLRASLLVYLLPLAGLLAGAFSGRLLFPAAGEGVVILSGILGFILGFAVLRRRSSQLAADPRLQPVVLRRDCLRHDV